MVRTKTIGVKSGRKGKEKVGPSSKKQKHMYEDPMEEDEQQQHQFQPQLEKIETNEGTQTNFPLDALRYVKLDAPQPFP